MGLSDGSLLLPSVALLGIFVACDAVLRSCGGVRDDCGGEVGERISSPMGEENGIRGICEGTKLRR